MARNSFAVDHVAPGADVQVYRNNNGALIAIGNPFTPASATLTADDGISHVNLAVEFAGDLYCVVSGAEIRKFNPSTQNWDLETLPAFTADANYDHTGLYVGFSATGVPRLACMFRDNSNLARVLYLELGSSWALGAVGPTVAQSVGHGPSSAMAYRNVLYCAIGQGDVVSWDFAADTWTSQTVAGDSSRQFFRADGRFFLLAAGQTNTDYMDVYEFNGASFSLLIDGSASTPSTLIETIGSFPGDSLAYDVIYDAALGLAILFSLSEEGGSNGLKVLTIDLDTLVVTDVTASVAPSLIAHPGGPAINGQGNVRAQVNNETDPLNQEVTVWVQFDSGSYAAYLYTDNVTEMTSVGSGGSKEIALSRVQSGGGEYFYEGSDTANPHRSVLEVQQRVPIAGGSRLFFTAYLFDQTGGAPAVTDVTLALYFNTADEGDKGSPGDLAEVSAAAKVSGAGSSPTLNAGKIENVTPDGSTIYSADWNAVGGTQVADGEFHQLMPRLEI